MRLSRTTSRLNATILACFAAIGLLLVEPAGTASAGGIYSPASNMTYFKSTSNANWAGALAASQAFPGGNLASIHSAADNALITQLGGGWVGYNNIGQSGTTGYVWSDGTPTTYTNWNSGEPNNSGSVEHVTEVNGSGGWNDNNQVNVQGYVREQAGPVGSFDAATGKTYYVVPATDWNTANAEAASMHLSLVTIHDSAENTFVSDLMASVNVSTAWLGLQRDGGMANNFTHWVDGTPLSFTSWNSGEPNNSGGVESVATMIAGGNWNDISPNNTFFAIMQTPEPSSFILCGLGAIGLLFAARRRRQS